MKTKLITLYLNEILIKSCLKNLKHLNKNVKGRFRQKCINFKQV